MNPYNEPSPFLWWESNLWWVVALSVSAGLGAMYWLLWGPRQPGDVLRATPASGSGRLRRGADVAAWGAVAAATLGPMVFVTLWLVSTDSLVHHCELIAGRPSFSYFIRPQWFGLALVALVGSIVYARGARRLRDARDVLCIPLE